ncbi:hypothetical protein AcV5_000311 [Taiwanofungus camphoratus]|nr:hypothetical protein AcV5_000311 [Antrodia cinnamomea]
MPEPSGFARVEAPGLSRRHLSVASLFASLISAVVPAVPTRPPTVATQLVVAAFSAGVVMNVRSERITALEMVLDLGLLCTVSALQAWVALGILSVVVLAAHASRLMSKIRSMRRGRSAGREAQV